MGVFLSREEDMPKKKCRCSIVFEFSDNRYAKAQAGTESMGRS